MATVYSRVNGKKLTKLIAQVEVVQRELDTRALEIAVRAEADLAQHRSAGDAYIEVDTGRIDRWVSLNDERGLGAAMSIEYGRQPHTNDAGEEVGGMEGLFILHRAAHLPH